MTQEAPKNNDLRGALASLLELDQLSDMSASLATVVSVETGEKDRRVMVRIPEGLIYDDVIWCGVRAPAGRFACLVFLARKLRAFLRDRAECAALFGRIDQRFF